MVDCGEGTQRQLIRIGIGINQISHILLTHLHADHYLGVPGMMKTWQLWGRQAPVAIYGPKGLLDFLDVLKRLIGKVDYPVTWHELAPSGEIPFDDFQIVGVHTQHKISSLGYMLVEDVRPGRFDPAKATQLGVTPGPDFGKLQHGESIPVGDRIVRPEDVMGPTRGSRKLVFTGDTRPCASVIEASRDADLLVHDATFTGEAQQRAEQTMHSTGAEAAGVGKAADVKVLALTHSSFRHHPREILAEARTVFERVILPNDFDRLVIPLPEKGEAYLVKSEFN